MKKLIATLCLAGSTLALSACDSTTMGHVDTDPPYALERTAKHKQKAMIAGETITEETYSASPTKMKPAEPVFQRAQEK